VLEIGLYYNVLLRGFIEAKGNKAAAKTRERSDCLKDVTEAPIYEAEWML